MNAKHDAIVQLVNAIAEAIAEAGSRGIPSGHLYAALMGKMTLAQFEALISLAVKAGKVKREGFLLRAA